MSDEKKLCVDFRMPPGSAAALGGTLLSCEDMIAGDSIKAELGKYKFEVTTHHLMKGHYTDWVDIHVEEV